MLDIELAAVLAARGLVTRKEYVSPRGRRVLGVLNTIPLAVRAATLLPTYGGPRTDLYKQLVRFEGCGKLVRVSKTRPSDLWASTRWFDRKSGAPTEVLRMVEATRKHLPSRRRTITQKVRVGGQSVYYSVGLYPDGSPGELFIDVAKAGAALRTWAGEAGMMLSIALQHGTPLPTIVDLFVGTKCEPSGPVEGHSRIARCQSIMDLIARDLAITFLGREDLADTVEWEVPSVPLSDQFTRTEPTDPNSCQCHSVRAGG